MKSVKFTALLSIFYALKRLKKISFTYQEGYLNKKKAVAVLDMLTLKSVQKEKLQ